MMLSGNFYKSVTLKFEQAVVVVSNQFVLIFCELFLLIYKCKNKKKTFTNTLLFKNEINAYNKQVRNK